MGARSAPGKDSAPESARRADARSLALGILRRARRGEGRVAPLLASVRRHGVAERDLRLATEILYGTLRWRPTLAAIVRRLSRRRPPAAEISDVLEIALYQILVLDRVPEHAAVACAVEQARRLGGSPAAGFVNALLRESCRRGRALLESPAGASEEQSLAWRYAHPSWLVRRWLERWGAGTVEALLAWNQEPPEVALWPAPGRGDLGAELAAAGVDCGPALHVPGALRARGGALSSSVLHREGRLVIQDEGSQLVAWLLERPIVGPVLDMCAGSGGKTAQMVAAASPGAVHVATDRARRPLRALRARLSRLGLPGALVACADWEEGEAVRRRFNVVLVDAPCTGSGVLRRRPEIKERLRESDIAALCARQDRLLEAAARLTAPGGELVYAVCSLEPEEGALRIEAFLRRHPEYERAGPGGAFPAGAGALLSPEGDLCTLPWRDKADGFYAARLRPAFPATMRRA